MRSITQESLYARAHAEVLAKLPPEPQSTPITAHLHNSAFTQHPHYPEVIVPRGDIVAVYVLQMGPYFKVGQTVRPFKRIPEITAGLPVRPIPIHIIPVSYAPELEYVLHRKFASSRTHGEWFYLTLADNNYLSAILHRMPVHAPDAWDWEHMTTTERRVAIGELCEELVPYNR